MILQFAKMSEFVIVDSNQPAKICLDIDQSTLNSLVAKKSHLAVSIKSYQLAQSESNSFMVYLLDDKSKSHFLTTFGIFPGESFDAKSDQEYRRFYIPLSKSIANISSQGELCFEIALDTITQESTKASQAEVAIEISKISQ